LKICLQSYEYASLALHKLKVIQLLISY